MSLGYITGAGMGATAHEDLSIVTRGEGREYLLKRQEEALQAERLARKGMMVQGGIMIKTSAGWQTFTSEWLPDEEAVASWQEEKKRQYGEQSPIGFLAPQFVLIANQYKAPPA